MTRTFGPESPASPATAPLLLYDGACGLCAASVQFVLKHERTPLLRFAPLAGSTAAGVRNAHPELTGVDSLILARQNAVSMRSTAVLELAPYLRWPWSLLWVGWIVPRVLRDGIYRMIARHRHRLGAEVCFVPPPEVRERFLP